MTELEQYIRSHAAEFDTDAPAEGHQVRFLARLDESAPARTAIPSFRTALLSFRAALLSFRAKSRNLFPARVFAYALAACLAILQILRPGPSRDFRFVGNDPQAIYLAYMDRVAGLYEQPSADSETRDALLQDLTEEAEPLFTQLPDELSRRERGRILKDYYGRILAAAREIQ